MIDERYKRAIEALSTTYFDRLGTNPQFNEQEFIKNMCQRVVDGRDLTPNIKAVLDKLVRKFTEQRAGGPQVSTAPATNRAPVEMEPIERGRFQAHKVQGGWQIFIDKMKVGAPVDYKGASVVIYWLEDAMDDLGVVIASNMNGAPAGAVQEDVSPF